MKKLTPAFIKTLKPKTKRYTRTEANLLWRVLPSGRIVFKAITQIKGRTTEVHLATFPNNKIDSAQIEQLKNDYAEHYLAFMAGKLPDTPLEEAQKQLQARKKSEYDKRVAQELSREQARKDEGGWDLYAEENPEELTVGRLCEEFIEKYSRVYKKSASGDEQIVKTLKPILNTPLFAVDRKFLINFLQTVNGKVYPNRVKAFLSKCFNWAEDNGYIEENPAVRLPSNPEKKRRRILSDDEIAQAWPSMRPIHRFLLVTGQRRGEVASMLWKDLKDNQWTIPETKNSNPHLLRLPKLAMSQLPDRDGNAVWKNRDGDWPIRSDTINFWWDKDKAEMGIADVTPHDLRRTVITNLTRVTGDANIGKKIANQTLQGVDARYNLFAWDKEKEDALKKWEKLLKQIIG
jgi:integrase